MSEENPITVLDKRVTALENSFEDLNKKMTLVMEGANAIIVSDPKATDINSEAFKTKIIVGDLTFQGIFERGPDGENLGDIEVEGWGDEGEVTKIDVYNRMKVHNVSNLLDWTKTGHIHWDHENRTLRINNKGEGTFIYISNGYLLSKPIECPV